MARVHIGDIPQTRCDIKLANLRLADEAVPTAVLRGGETQNLLVLNATQRDATKIRTFIVAPRLCIIDTISSSLRDITDFESYRVRKYPQNEL